ncbi:MAG: AAA family ATPase, partial [Campylobacter sp.]|nr:AAA family ATPase [Campylobacter sp.]
MAKYYTPEFSHDMANMEKFLNNGMFVLSSLDLLSRTVFANENGNVDIKPFGTLSLEDYVMIFKNNGINRKDFLISYNGLSQVLQGEQTYLFQQPLRELGEFTAFDDIDEKTENTQNEQQGEINPNEYLINLNEKAKKGKFDKLIGREKETAKTLQTLCRRKKNNPMLLGEAGVGKTAIVEGLALKLIENKVPAKLQGKVIYALDTGALIAGTTLRGMFEERAKAAIDWLKNQDNAIVFIDEIHTIMGLGDSEGGASDLASIIKPALANGEISCIGATTYAEFRKFEKDKALMRRFSKVDISEPSIEESVEILKGVAGHYEDFHAVKFSDEILHEAVVLAKRY